MTVAGVTTAWTNRWPGVRWPDPAVAVLLCVVGVSQPLVGWHDGGVGQVPSGQVVARVLLTLPLTLPLAWRRSHPIAAVLGVASAVVVQVLVVPYVPFLAGLVPLVVSGYSAAAHGDRARVVGLLAPVASVGAIMARVPEERVPGEVLFSAFVLVGTWLAGDAVHARLRRARAEVASARRRLVEEQVQQERARTAERALIARELHDVIAHSVSLMGVQAGAARTQLTSDPAAAARALLSVEDAARTSVAELQRLLRLLREPPDEDRGSARARGERSPQPGLGDLADLVHGFRGAGLDVRLDQTVVATSTAGLGLAVYRIVQEALTNALRHGTGDAMVRVTGRPHIVEVEVRNPCRDVGGAPRRGGHGLAGMSERAALYGGEFAAGPDGAGEFIVRARLRASATGGDLP